MSEQVTVKSFGDGNPWSSDDGKISLTFFETVFDRGGTDFTANWGKKEGEPSVGESLEGEFYQKDGKWRFRKASKPQGGGGEYKGGGAKSPDQQASIVRQHSQEMAVRVHVAAGTFREVDPETDEARVKQALTKWTDFFAEDASSAQTADGGGGPSVSPPEATTAPAPAQTSDTQGTHELLTKHLEANGLDWSTAKLLTDWMIETQSPEKQDEAISALQDDARRDKCVAWAKAGYEAKHGALPTVAASGAGDGDDIPFARPEYGELFSERERRSNR